MKLWAAESTTSGEDQLVPYNFYLKLWPPLCGRRLQMPACALSLADLAYLGALCSLLLCGGHLPGIFLPD